ncbi:MAG: glycosyltransferase family 39 protein [Nevskia sp.]
MAEVERLSGAHAWLLIAVIVLGFWVKLGSVPLFDLDEGAFSEATVEMLNSGNYLSTTLNGEPRYDKPILIYWLQAASVSAFGKTAFAFRLPSALCATLWLLVVYHYTLVFTRERRAAILAAASLGLGLMSSIIGHAAIADALLNLWLALALLDIYRHAVEPSRSRLLRVYLWMGLGFLTKGPIAVALPLIVSAVYYVWQQRGRLWLKAVFNPPGWLVFAAVVLPWVLPLWFKDHGEFLRHFLLDHNLNRYDSTLQGHGGKPWYYLAVLPLIVLPFTAMLPAVFRRAHAPDPLDGFLLLWFLVVFVFFSFSGTQLPHYLLYGATPLFILIGRSWRSVPARFWTLLPALLLTALFAGLPWLLPLVPVNGDRPYEAGILALAASSFEWPYLAITIGAALSLLYLLFVPGLSARRALVGAAILVTIQLWFAVVPVLAGAQQEPVREAALRARELKLPVVSYRSFLPSFSVYRGAITPNRLPDPGELVFVKLNRIPDLQRELGATVTLIPEFKKGGVALLLRQIGPNDPKPPEDEPAATP